MGTEQREADFDILIQGAGIGGLTLAIALQQRGYSVKIVERSETLSEVGAGIWMAANPMQVFDQLGIAENVTAAGWMVKRLRLQDYRGFDIQVTDMSAVAKLFGFETVALHRSVLQKVLFEQLPADTVLFGTEVKALSQDKESVSVQLADGSRVRARVVVGADGINSRIRSHLSLGGEKRYSGYSSYRAIAKRARLLPAESDHEAYEIWGEGCRVGFSKINADDYYWYMTFDSPAGETRSVEQMRSHAGSLFKTFFPQWGGLLEYTSPEEILRTDISDLKPLKKWSSGRVGLIGDAAHATTPNLGQGGAMAVEDALALAKSFQEVGLSEAAFERFEQRRRDKVNWAVSTSWTIGKMCHIKNPIVRSLRNAVLMYSPKSVSRKQIVKLYSIG
ncbi:MAG TPA: FAD-dependent monooxygenase [Acidobacteriaceae bacterium]|jgi:2-polyprenyl-6-methoxyphenol hydroxylase-like FAD-dependent oxidoreductase